MNTLICLLAIGLADPPAPLLECAGATAAKGNVKSGRPLIHTFELTHRGNGTLTITQVTAGCGCLRQSLTSTVLAPGETTRLALEVNTLTQPEGENRWQVVVKYKVETPGTPPATGERLLTISATLSREISVNPSQIGFSTAGTASQVVTILDSRAKPMTVLKAVASSPNLHVHVAAREAGKGQSVTVALSADAPTGHRDEFVTLFTDDREYPELRIPVRVLKRTAGEITPTPEKVSVRFASGQTEVSTLVQLRSSDGKPIGISSAESDQPGVIAKWSPGAAANVVVRVTVTESAAVQSGTCNVRVKLDGPGGPEVVIPVAWTGIKK